MVENDHLNVIHERAAGLDIHKVEITASVRIAQPGKEAVVETRQFSAFPKGLAGMVRWLQEHRVSAAVMEGTGIYWEAPFQALEDAGIKPVLVHAQHVKQIKGRKTDVADSIWLAGSLPRLSDRRCGVGGKRLRQSDRGAARRHGDVSSRATGACRLPAVESPSSALSFESNCTRYRQRKAPLDRRAEAHGSHGVPPVRRGSLAAAVRARITDVGSSPRGRGARSRWQSRRMRRTSAATAQSPLPLSGAYGRQPFQPFVRPY